MGFRRGLSTTGVIIARRLRPSYYCHIHQDNRDEPVQSPLDKSKFVAAKYLPQAAYNKSNMIGSRFWGGPYPSFEASARLSSPYSRYMSSSSGDISSGDIFGEVITESIGVVASQVPAISEVAVAAADSAYPVAALQYLIDGVHSFTGLNWWASIALTTILIRGAMVPLLINELRSIRRLKLMLPQWEELNKNSNSWTKDAETKRLHKQRVSALFKEYGVTPFTPFKGLLIRIPVFISFCFAILNMVDKVPSFHAGGTLWFTDLTTPDSYYILPLLTALTIWINVECKAFEFKYFSRIIAVVAVPVMTDLPQALFSYWLPLNIFSLCYRLVIRQPGVKRYFNIPEVPVQPPPAKQTSPLPLFSVSFKGVDNVTKPDYDDETSMEPTRSVRKISSSSVRSQRIRSLEKKIRASKKINATKLDYDATSMEPTRSVRKISSSSVLNRRIRSLEKKIRASKRNKS